MAPPAQAVETPSEGNDERLLIEAAQQDPLRFAALYEKHFDRVYAFIARRAGDRAEAEDLTAEVFHRALENLARFEWRGVPFLAWLLQIARNSLADRWERAAREGREAAPAIDDGMSDATRTDSGMSADVDRRAALSELVNRLPHDQQRVIVARFVEQRSIREIATLLGRTEGAVKQLQLRALANLRARMEGRHA